MQCQEEGNLCTRFFVQVVEGASIVVLALPGAVARDVLPSIATVLDSGAVVVNAMGVSMDAAYVGEQLRRNAEGIVCLSFPDMAQQRRILRSLSEADAEVELERGSAEGLQHADPQLWRSVDAATPALGEVCGALLFSVRPSMVRALARLGERFGLSAAVSVALSVSAIARH